MFNKLNIFLGLKDDKSDLEASFQEKFIVYGTYVAVIGLTLLAIL